MRCHACSALLPVDVSVLYDAKVDRFYCLECHEIIDEVIQEMSNPRIKTQPYDLIDGAVEILDEDYDDFLERDSDCIRYDTQDEDTWAEFNLPPENYDE